MCSAYLAARCFGGVGAYLAGSACEKKVSFGYLPDVESLVALGLWFMEAPKVSGTHAGYMYATVSFSYILQVATSALVLDIYCIYCSPLLPYS